MKTLGAALLLGAFGCGGEAPVVVMAVMDGADGVSLDQPWVVTFDRWISSIDQIQLSDAKGRVRAGNGNTNIAVDFVDADEPIEVVTFPSPKGTFDFNFGSEVPVIGDARASDGVTDGVLLSMDRNGWTHLVQGRAIGPAGTDGLLPILTFELGFDIPVRQLACGAGVEVGGDGAEAVIHLVAESLFWLSLTDDDPATGFNMLANADLDEDTVLTVEELQAFGLGGLDGAGQANNVYQFVRANLARSMRLGPDGRCDARL